MPRSSTSWPRPRGVIIGFAVAALLVVIGAAAYYFGRFPPDTTPEGAYLRVTASLGRGDARVVFSYLDDDAQHACYTIRDYRKKASERVRSSYPEPERSRLLAEYGPHATAEDGADVWLDIAKRKGFITRLRRDLSGISRVEIVGDRATIVTARDTRYGLRRRENGMWGLTLFTADLTAEAERAARDLSVVSRAADDYDRK